MTFSRVLAPGLFLGCVGAICLSQGAGCKEPTGASSAPAAILSHVADPIVIGVSLGLSGELSDQSGPLQNATRTAEQYVNSVGGILGRPVSFQIVDDTSEIDQATKVATAFATQNLLAVLGPVESSQALEVTQVLAPRRILELSGTASSGLLATQQPPLNRWFFRTAPSDDDQAKVFANFAFQGPARLTTDAGARDSGNDQGTATSTPLGCRSMSLIYADDPDAGALATSIKRAFMALGGNINFEEQVPFDVQQSYQSTAQLAVEAQSDCLALVVYSAIAGKVMIDLRREIAADNSNHDWSNFFVVASDDAHDDELITSSQLDPSNPKSPSAAENVYGTVANTSPDTAEYVSFVKLYAASYPLPPGATDPPPFTANQFDAAVLLALAIEQAGTTTDSALIRDALFLVSKGGRAFGPSALADAIVAIHAGTDIDYSGASGACDFDEYGDVQAGFILWKNEKQPDGTFKLVTVSQFKGGQY